MYFIPGNAVSKKNSKQIGRIFHGKNKGKRIIINNDAYLDWAMEAKYRVNILKHAILYELAELPKPYIIGLHFVRKTKQAFDFNNMSQGIMDVLTTQGVLTDDNFNECFPVPMSRNGRFYSIDKNHPGIYIKLFNSKTYPYVF